MQLYLKLPINLVLIVLSFYFLEHYHRNQYQYLSDASELEEPSLWEGRRCLKEGL